MNESVFVLDIQICKNGLDPQLHASLLQVINSCRASDVKAGKVCVCVFVLCPQTVNTQGFHDLVALMFISNR